MGNSKPVNNVVRWGRVRWYVFEKVKGHNMKKRKRLKVMNEKTRHTMIPSVSLVEIGGKVYPKYILLRDKKLIKEVCDLAEQASSDPATYITELVVDWIVENRRKMKDPDPFRHGNSHYDEVWDKDAIGAYT